MGDESATDVECLRGIQGRRHSLHGTLAEEVRTFGIDVNAIAPGIAQDTHAREMLTAGRRELALHA